MTIYTVTVNLYVRADSEDEARGRALANLEYMYGVSNDDENLVDYFVNAVELLEDE